jgi:Na+/phosphate symporter
MGMSDTLMDALAEIEEYQANSPHMYEDLTPLIAQAKCHMRILMRVLFTPDELTQEESQNLIKEEIERRDLEIKNGFIPREE